jgi:murein DD-endopeptidase MepM/ murein hydrolase activator NlpD
MRSPLKNSSQIMITSDFGFRKYEGGQYFHTGIDIGVDVNTPIYATGNGTISKVTQDSTSGKYIEIKHAHGLYSQYLHLNTQNVKVGDNVRAGDVIGYSGNTGRSTGPHLHYQIWWNKGKERAYIDILCPCASSYRRNDEKKSHTKINTSQYTCEHSALKHPYCFYGNEKEHRVDWRIKSKHCMDGSSRTQKLPDETGKCK